MSHSPPKRSLPSPSTKSHADFNWPPPDEELAQCFVTLQSETALDGTGVKTAEPSEAPASLAPQEASVIPSDPPASAEARDAAFDCPRGEGSTRSDAEDPKHSRIEDSMTSGIAVAQSESALAGTSAGEMAAEIAHVQALIEGLTQKVEWRITNVSGR